MNNLAPNYLVNKFTMRSDIHTRSTRNNHLLGIPPFKTSSGQRTFQYSATKIWNDLDDNLIQITSLHKFKRKLKEHLLRNCYGIT